MADDAAAPAGRQSEDAEAVSATDPAELEQPADEADASTTSDVTPAEPKKPRSVVARTLIAGLVVVAALAAAGGWLGWREYQDRQAQDRHNLFLQVGRQGAVNLTTIDFERVDDDVQRILDSATGTFYDEFQGRAEPFTQVVKQVRSKAVGNVTEAAVESETGTDAQVLVAVTVNTTVDGQPDQAPRAWRMRILVQETAPGEAKVANVEFVP